MLFCAPKLVRDLLFRSYARPSVRPLKPSIPSSACQSIRPLIRPPFVSLILRLPAHSSVLPSVCFSFCLVCPSARPSSFLPLFCQSIRVSVLFRFSVRVCLSVRLFIPYVDPICPSGHQSVHPFVCPSFQTPMPLSFRSSVRLTIYLFTMAPDK